MAEDDVLEDGTRHTQQPGHLHVHVRAFGRARSLLYGSRDHAAGGRGSPTTYLVRLWTHDLDGTVECLLLEFRLLLGQLQATNAHGRLSANGAESELDLRLDHCLVRDLAKYEWEKCKE